MPVSIEEAFAHLKHRHESDMERAQARAWRLRAKLPLAALTMRARYGVARVVLFGSLASGEPSLRCDVDIAVEGLSEDCYFQALADLMELFEAPVDLVQLEHAPESLRARIAAEGKDL